MQLPKFSQNFLNWNWIRYLSKLQLAQCSKFVTLLAPFIKWICTYDKFFSNVFDHFVWYNLRLRIKWMNFIQLYANRLYPFWQFVAGQVFFYLKMYGKKNNLYEFSILIITDNHKNFLLNLYSKTSLEFCLLIFLIIFSIKIERYLTQWQLA